jgi:hypothetical protein
MALRDASYWIEQPCCVEHIAAGSMLHGVSVPPHPTLPVCHWQPRCVPHDVMSMNVLHELRLPVHWFVHEQPACAPQVACVPNVVHSEGLLVQLVPLHEQPDCATHVTCVVKLKHAVAEPVQLAVVEQPGQLLHPMPVAQFAHVPHEGKPLQKPAPASDTQPGHAVHVPREFAHCWHVVQMGVPEHVGDTRNSCGGGGSFTSVVWQQICPVQSSFDAHCLPQVFAHTPAQHSCPVALQSADVVQDFGHGSYIGFKQRPATLSDGSTVFADVQQISPLPVLQSLLVMHPRGQRFAGTQMFCE